MDLRLYRRCLIGCGMVGVMLPDPSPKLIYLPFQLAVFPLQFIDFVIKDKQYNDNYDYSHKQNCRHSESPS